MKSDLSWYELSSEIQLEDMGFVQQHSFHPARSGVPYWILVLLDRGHRTLRADGKEIRIGPREFFLLPPYTVQEPLDEDGHTACYAHFYAPWKEIHMPSHVDAGRLLFPLYGGLPTDQDCFSHLHYLCEHMLSPYADSCFGAMQLHAILSVISLHCQKHPQSTQRKAAFHDSCLTFINDHACMPIRAVDYENALGLSYHQINQKFKDHFGYTVKQYHQRVRMKHAAQMLQSGMSVQQTAQQCGYDDYYFFIRSFTREHGVSPSAYRSLHGMKEELESNKTNRLMID